MISEQLEKTRRLSPVRAARALHLRSSLGFLRSRAAVFFLFLLLIGFLSAFGAVVISNCLFFAVIVFFIALKGKRKRENEDIGYRVSDINIPL